MKIIIKPFAEIMVKSKPVRKKYLSMLQSNIALAIKKIDEKLRVKLFWDKLEIEFDDNLSEENKELLKKTLQKIPGIEHFLEVYSFYMPNHIIFTDNFSHYEDQTKEIFDFIFDKTSLFYKNIIENKTFVVRVKRSGNHSFTSLEMERYLGHRLLLLVPTAKVDLINPQVSIFLEIKDSELFIVNQKLYSIGGYPIGVQDRVISLISGGFDSSVSSFLMMKRGVKVDFLFFNLGGKAHEIGVKQISNYLWKNFSYGHKARFVSVPFEEVVGELLTKIKGKYRAIILKRLFLKVSDILAKKYEYYALVKGDSLGQVSSQTLKNMHVIDKASDTLVLRPLITYNKQEIIDISKKIGTYDFSCNMPEYCSVVSDKPATGANLHDVLDEEVKFDFSLLEKAIENMKVEYIDNMLDFVNEENDLEITYLPAENELIIDIREDEKIKKEKINIVWNDILNIPFFEINNKFASLDQSKTYLFYCEKGVLSNLHGLYLKEKGFNNIKILRILEKSCNLTGKN